MDVKVRDYPDLVKRGGGIVNMNQDEFMRAKARIKHAQRIDTLETDVKSVHEKLDFLINLLVKQNEC